MRYSAFDPGAFAWDGVTAGAYKDDPGTARGMGWQGLTRHTLVRAPEKAGPPAATNPWLAPRAVGDIQNANSCPPVN